MNDPIPIQNIAELPLIFFTSLEGEDVVKEAGEKQLLCKQPLGAAGSPG